MIGFIINPLSGNGNGLKVWVKVQQELEKQNVLFVYTLTSRTGEAIELASKLAKEGKVERIVVIGGDGTISEAAAGIVQAGLATASLSGASCPLSVIPAGTGNDYAKAHGIPVQPLEALKLILARETKAQSIDLIELNQRFVAVNNIGAGFDGLVAKLTNEAAYKKVLNGLKLGKLAYFITMVRVFSTYQSSTITLQIDGVKHELTDAWLAATANIPFYGGSMQICPHALADDGWLDVVVIRSSSRWKVLSILFSVYKGKHINHPAVTFYKGQSIHIHSDKPLLVQSDGESAGTTPISLHIKPLALSILIGSRKGK